MCFSRQQRYRGLDKIKSGNQANRSAVDSRVGETSLEILREESSKPAGKCLLNVAFPFLVLPFILNPRN